MLLNSTTFTPILSNIITAVKLVWTVSTLFIVTLFLCTLSVFIVPWLDSFLVGQTFNQTDPTGLNFTILTTSATTTITYPKWFEPISQPFQGSTRQPNIGLVNMGGELLEGLESLHANVTYVEYDEVSPNVQWTDIYPLWIDEEGKHKKPWCPVIPMPDADKYRGLDVVVAKVSCGNSQEQKVGIRDVYRLQINLVASKLATLSSSKEVSVVFVSDGGCEPMWEIFRCDDLVSRQGQYWVYKPDVLRLKQKISLPVGACQIADQPHNSDSETKLEEPGTSLHSRDRVTQPVREAYVTVLHSSDRYVCGAIALAQSILLTNTTKDLVLLADKSLTPRSINALKAAGWKIKLIERIRCPSAQKGHYNEWNCSKLRLWQLTEYTKVIFIDSDFIVLKNVDHLFAYPQLSATEDTMSMFNSGVMLIEPSKCLFDSLVAKSYTLRSYNGGDQGLLNEAFTWWHRIARRLAFIKYFMGVQGGPRNVPNDVYMIHFVGVKPWFCYRDYDCNWDNAGRRDFASDEVHSKWWQIYDTLPDHLRPYCGLTKATDHNIKIWRDISKNDSSSSADEHWKIDVQDPRQFNLKDYL